MALSVSRKHGPEAQNRRGGALKGVRASDEARAAARECAAEVFETAPFGALPPLGRLGRLRGMATGGHGRLTDSAHRAEKIVHAENVESTWNNAFDANSILRAVHPP